MLSPRLRCSSTELPPSGKKVGCNLLNDEDFTIPYITNTTPNSPASHQLTAKARRKMWIIYINGEEPITDKGALNEVNCHQNTRGKPKFKISIKRRKCYQSTYLEEIRSRFCQVRPVVSHIEIHLPKKPTTPKNIGEGFKGPQR